MDKPRVVVGMPRYHNAASFGAVKAMLWPTHGMCEIVHHMTPCTSILEHCFNQIWCHALNMKKDVGATHFAMIHSDVDPQLGWLDTLMSELKKFDADLVSVVIPIKNSCGLTSTALHTGDLWNPRRLTLTEAMQLPETFAEGDVGYPLLVNTGLWVCRLDRHWVDEVCFDSLKRIVTLEDGSKVAQCVSEDWFFSDQLNQRGCKVMATRKVPLVHHGEREFDNERPWGLWKTDQSYEAAHGESNPPIGVNHAREVPEKRQQQAGRPELVSV